MSNTFSITACDNELFLFAYTTNESYILAHLNSGNNYPVNVTVTVESGAYTQVPYLDGQSGALDASYTAYLPGGTTYPITAVCVNWGGPWAYSYSLNGGSSYSQTGPSGVGAIAAGPELTVSLPPSGDSTIIFSGLTPGGSTDSYTESGYTLSGTSIYASTYGVTPPGTAAFPSASSTQFTFQSANGIAFTLISVDITNLNADVGAQTVVFTGNSSNGDTATETIQTDPGYGYNTYTFSAMEFVSLTSVVWDPGSTCITNIQVSTAP